MSLAIASKPATVEPAASDADKLVNEALARLTTIGTLPEVTVQIIKTVEDPRSSAGQLNAIVSHDPALVTRVLKVVNSSFYGLPGQVASIERAIVLLGLNGVKNLAVAASLGQLFRGVKLCEPFTARDLWTHCVAVAVASRELAGCLETPVADEAFLAGMIHDVGLIAHLQLWPEKLRQVCEEAKALAAGIEEGKPYEGESFLQVERRIIGLDHEQLGRGLAQRWRFPKSCQEVAGNHHRPAGPNDHRILVNAVHIADTLCCQFHKGFDLTAMGQQVTEADVQALGASKADYEQTVATLPDKIAEGVAIFG